MHLFTHSGMRFEYEDELDAKIEKHANPNKRAKAVRSSQPLIKSRAHTAYSVALKQSIKSEKQKNEIDDARNKPKLLRSSLRERNRMRTTLGYSFKSMSKKRISEQQIQRHSESPLKASKKSPGSLMDLLLSSRLQVPYGNENLKSSHTTVVKRFVHNNSQSQKLFETASAS